MPAVLNKIVVEFDELTYQEKEYVFEIIKKQLIESRRKDIALKGKKAVKNLKEGKVKKGNLEELYQDLEND